MGRTQAHILASTHAARGQGEPRPPGADRQIADAFNAALLAIMGRRRMVVLTGPPAERLDVLVRLARHLEADGALVLPAGGRAEAGVGHLLRAAAHVTLPPGQFPARFDVLVDHLADLLETMGTGVLLVDNADRLGAATLSDLIEMSGSQSETGRFLQIVLAGPDALLRRMTEDERNLFSGVAVAVPLTPAAAPESTTLAPVAAPPAEPSRAAEDRGAASRPSSAAPARVEPQTQLKQSAAAVRPGAHPVASAAHRDFVAGEPAIAAPASPVPHLDRPRLQAPLPPLRPLAGGRPPRIEAATRHRRLWAASTGVAVIAFVVALAAAPRWVGDTADSATRSVADLIDRLRSLRPTDAGVAEAARTVPVHTPAAQRPTAATPSTIVDRATQPTLPAPATAPPKAKPPPTELALTPPTPSVQQPPAAERPNLPVEALSMREPPPLDTSAAIPKEEPASDVATATAAVKLAPVQPPAPRDTPVLRDAQGTRGPDAPETTARVAGASAPREIAIARADIPPPPAPPGVQSGSTALPIAPSAVGASPPTPASVTALVNQARRQIDDRRLTTPIGDNALETVRAMEAAAAAGVEPARLRAAIVDSYLRLGALAEQRGQYPLARIYYRRAQQAIPDHEKIGARLEAVESRLEEIRGEVRREARPDDLAVQPSLPSDAPKLR